MNRTQKRHRLIARAARLVSALALCLGAGTVLGGAAAAAGSTLTASVTSVPNGSTITFSYSTPDATNSAKNWVGLYQPGQTPGDVGSITWQCTPGTSGSVTFSSSNLSGVGDYVAYYLYNDGYQVLAGPVGFSVVPSSPAPAPHFERVIGASGQGQLAAPAAVATAQDSSVWVADTGANRVEHFSAGGRLLRSFGGGLSHPHGITLDGAGNVWVSNTGNDQVAEFSAAGRPLTTFGSAGSGNGQLDQPMGLAVAAGDVYVADQNNNRIEEFTPTGSFVRSIDVATPADLAFDKAGDIWVSSPSYADGNAVYEFAPDGAQLENYNSTQASFGALSNPAAIDVGQDGRIYVVQPDFGWVTVYNTDGSFYTEFGLQRDPALASEDLAFPQGLAVGHDGSVYVADTGNGRVVEFAPAAHGSAAAASAASVPIGVPGPWLPAGLAALAAILLAAIVVLTRRRLSRPAPVTRAASTGAGQVVSRRSLLTTATALTGASVGAAVLPLSLRTAMAASLASDRRGSLRDIKHIVILMQENRSFDHYFGTMPGVRGFADPTAIKLSDGNPVFYQPDPSHAQGYLLPFHFDTRTTSAQATPGTDHSWETQHQAWNGGAMDQWIPAKGPFTMGYFGREDVPFHWALAEAFTICDNYHCSVFGPTNPNRLHLWTGMIDPNGTGGGPIIDNSPAFNNVILSWTTYPERLERARISWKVYQEEDNFDDNSLAWFKQYANAPSSSPLRQRGIAFGRAGDFEADVTAGRLPQVSWLVAPTAQTEHPDYFPAAGAEYIAQKLDAIAANPDVWASTAFILCYDENDGLFDHVPPPVPPVGTAAEFVSGLPIGLGFRTPTTIVSPWTAGGFVCSDVFDHTSLIRFIEARFGVREPNISAWRRQTCGDLTSAFRFARTPARYPGRSGELALAVTESRLLRAQRQVNDLPAPVIPAVNEPLPSQARRSS